MDDRVNPPASPEAPRMNLAKLQAVPWLLFIMMLGVAAWLGMKAFGSDETSDPVASALLTFEKQNSLTVFSSRFEVLASSTDSRGVLGVDLLNSQQTVIMPAMVEYRVELGTVGRDRMSWDEDTSTLDVRLPPLKISRPNVDEAKARVFTKGVWVTSNAQDDLRRNNARQAERKAVEFASEPQILAMARTAGKEAIRQNLAIPLAVAGFEDAQVTVRFDGEPTSTP
jgi:hypothetical protein